MSTQWIAFPNDSSTFQYPGAALKKQWSRLHRGDCEPWPDDSKAQDAWRAFHAGDFARAVSLGLKAGGAAVAAADKAAMIYANYLEADAERNASMINC